MYPINLDGDSTLSVMCCLRFLEDVLASNWVKSEEKFYIVTNNDIYHNAEVKTMLLTKSPRVLKRAKLLKSERKVGYQRSK